MRGEDEGTDNSKLEEFHALVVNDVVDTNEKNKLGLTLYKIVLENGWEFIKPSKNEIDWKGKIKEFIITTEFTEDGITPKKNKHKAVERDNILINSHLRFFILELLIANLKIM